MRKNTQQDVTFKTQPPNAEVFIDGETVFGVKSFREGINALLDHANLKT